MKYIWIEWWNSEKEFFSKKYDRKLERATSLLLIDQLIDEEREFRVTYAD